MIEAEKQIREAIKFAGRTDDGHMIVEEEALVWALTEIDRLTRERDALLATVNNDLQMKTEVALRFELEQLQAELAEARAERDAMAKDAWRLDWLDAQWRDPIHLEISTRSVKGDGYVRECVLFMPKGEVRAADVRSTIDAALAQIEQENNDAARG